MTDIEIKKALETLIELRPWSSEQQRIARTLVPAQVVLIRRILVEEARKAKGKSEC